MKIRRKGGPMPEGLPSFPVELEHGSLVYYAPDGRDAFRLFPTDPSLAEIELVDANPQERLALHFAGFGAMAGVDVDIPFTHKDP